MELVNICTGTSQYRTSLERKVQNYHFLGLREEDNLSTVDKMAGPNVGGSTACMLMINRDQLLIRAFP